MANKIYKLGGTAEEINGVLTDLVDARTDEFDGQYLKVVTEDGETHIVADYASTKDGVGRVDETPDAENHGEIFNYYPEDAGASVNGIPNKATGKYSHAEGYQTAATGDNSHSEGNHTVAAGDNQHVSGKYNVKDNENKYAVIVGNGNENRKSNALTVDWDGNINCGITDPNGEQISYGTINGVDIKGLEEEVRNSKYTQGDGIKIEEKTIGVKAATKTDIGGVIVGDGLGVDEDGKIYAENISMLPGTGIKFVQSEDEIYERLDYIELNGNQRLTIDDSEYDFKLLNTEFSLSFELSDVQTKKNGNIYLATLGTIYSEECTDRLAYDSSVSLIATDNKDETVMAPVYDMSYGKKPYSGESGPFGTYGNRYFNSNESLSQDTLSKITNLTKSKHWIEIVLDGALLKATFIYNNDQLYSDDLLDYDRRGIADQCSYKDSCYFIPALQKCKVTLFSIPKEDDNKGETEFLGFSGKVYRMLIHPTSDKRNHFKTLKLYPVRKVSTNEIGFIDNVKRKFFPLEYLNNSSEKDINIGDGRFYFIDSATSGQDIENLSSDKNIIAVVPSSKEKLGGVIIGDGINVDEKGTISVNQINYRAGENISFVEQEEQVMKVGEYTLLESVTVKDGKTGYFLTDVDFDGKYTNFIMKTTIPTTKANNSEAIIGSCSNSNNPFGIFYERDGSTNKVKIDMFDETAGYLTNSSLFNNEIIVRRSYEDIYFYSGRDYSDLATYSRKSYFNLTSNEKLCIFGTVRKKDDGSYEVLNASTASSFYYCKIYRSGQLIRDYVPCINGSGEIGIIDLLTNNFIKGTGEFVVGNNLTKKEKGVAINANIPPATKDSLGLVKIGNGIDIDSTGTISVDTLSGEPYKAGKNVYFTEGVPRKIGNFTLVEYIDCYESGYIRTDYYGNSNTDVEIDCILYDPEVSDSFHSYIFGARSKISDSLTYEYGIATKFNGNYKGLFGGKNGSYYYIQNIKYNERIRLKTDNLSNINVYSYSEDKDYLTTTTQTYDLDFDIPYLIFAQNNSNGTNEYTGNYCNARLYSFKIYENKQLVRHYVPCVSDNGEVGVIDLLTEKFLPATALSGKQFNIGDSIIEPDDNLKAVINSKKIDGFISGNGIKIDSGIETYQLMDYISANSSYILTDISLTSKKHIYKFKFSRTYNTTTDSFFGYGSPSKQENSYMYGNLRFDNKYYIYAGFFDTTSNAFNNDDKSIVYEDKTSALFEGTVEFSNSKIVSTAIGRKDISVPLEPDSSEKVIIFGRLTHFADGNDFGAYSSVNDRMYYLDIYDEDILVAQLRPAKRARDGVVGIINLINNKFYYNGDKITGGNLLEKYITVESKDLNFVKINNTGILSITSSDNANQFNYIDETGQKTINIKTNVNSLISNPGISINQLKSEFAPSEQTYSTQAIGSTLTSSGNPTYPYFDTGVPASSDVKIEMILTIPRPTYDTIDGIYRAVPSALFGAKISDNDAWGIIIDTAYTAGIYGPGSGSSPLATNGYPFGSRAKLALDKERYYFAMLNADNTVSYEFANKSISMPEFKSDNTIHILHINGMDNILGSGYSSIESIKIYDKGALVRWYVPVVAWVSGSYNAGFYDIMNQTKSFSLRDGVKFNYSSFDSSNRTFLEPGINQLSLAPSTTSTIGGVIVGDGLTVDNDGKVSIKDYNALLARIEELERLAGISPST